MVGTVDFDLFDLLGQNRRMKTLDTEAARSLGEAKAHFAECVRAAEKGQVIVLTRHGRPVARLVPFEQSPVTTRRAAPSGEPRRDSMEVREELAEYEARATTSGYKVEARRAVLERLLEREIWPQIPQELIGKGPSKRERERILGIREDGT